MNPSGQQDGAKRNRRIYPWIWIVVAFACFMTLWFWFIRFATQHQPESVTPDKPPMRIRE